MKRRSLLQLGAISGVAGTINLSSTAASAESIQGNSVKQYATLGRTGLEIADISFGSSRLRPGQEDLVNYALDRGVNYFDTAESYTGGDSETVIGNALKGKRDKVILATKMHVGASTNRQTMMATLEQSRPN